LANIQRRKFATGEYIVSPPNTVYVTALPCKFFGPPCMCTRHSITLYWDSLLSFNYSSAQTTTLWFKIIVCCR